MLVQKGCVQLESTVCNYQGIEYMKKVAILQHRLLHYRTELFDKLRTELLEDGILLDLFHGKPSKTESTKRDVGVLTWSNFVSNFFITVRGIDILWQRLPPINNYDLIVLIQENRIISNYAIILLNKLFFKKKIAYWGHGKNMQSVKPDGLRELWKKYWLCTVDWWFGYTTGTKRYLIDNGFNPEKISVLNNSINTSVFRDQVNMVSEEAKLDLLSGLGLSLDNDICVFCGSIYSEKKIELLLEASKQTYLKNSKFVLVIIGDGPDRHLVDDYKNEVWLRYVGIKNGAEKAAYYSVSKLMLNPGLVGLHILDSFCSGVPMITTEDSLHSPEYDYLKDGYNGVVVKSKSDYIKYSNAILKCLEDKKLLGDLKVNCLKSSEIYSIDSMVSNFRLGILTALGYGNV